MVPSKQTLATINIFTFQKMEDENPPERKLSIPDAAAAEKFCPTIFDLPIEIIQHIVSYISLQGNFINIIISEKI